MKFTLLALTGALVAALASCATTPEPASLSQGVAQEPDAEIRFEKEPVSSQEPAGHGSWEPNSLDLVADRNPDGDDTWTEAGLYGFLVDISGEVQAGDLSVDGDVSFSDILRNLDLGGMASAQHRHGKWSFIVDVCYLKVTADDSVARKVPSRVSGAPDRDLSVDVEVEFQQFLAEAFVGYRVLDHEYGGSRLGVDVLGGARYNYLKADVDASAELLGRLLDLERSRSGDVSRGWVDGVVGLRVQLGQDHGWSVTGWADIGRGSDSSSYQLMGLLNYKFDNNIRVLAGYRFYNLDYKRGSGNSRREIDLDYTGPMIGLSYSF